jgi:hypothetical protein
MAKMATDDVVAPDKSASWELLALLLSPSAPQVPVPDIEEVKEILKICGDPAAGNEAAQT